MLRPLQVQPQLNNSGPPAVLPPLPPTQVFGPDSHQEKLYNQAIVPIVQEVRARGWWNAALRGVPAEGASRGSVPGARAQASGASRQQADTWILIRPAPLGTHPPAGALQVLDGFNCTIFAYGQTGTGKTFTMEGGPRNSTDGKRLSAGGWAAL